MKRNALIEIFQEEHPRFGLLPNNWRFRCRAANSEKWVVSEAYVSRSNAIRAAKAFAKVNWSKTAIDVLDETRKKS